jgi:molecular chaperone HtpG
VAASLGERLAGVRPSERLSESPSCLVREEHDLGPQLRRLLEAAGQKLPVSHPWLELNPTHPLVRRLDSTPDGEAFDDLAALLHDEAVLAEGGALEDPAGFVRRLNRVLAAAPAEAQSIIVPGAD